MGDIINFRRFVNGIGVEQRITDGFINATMMCLAHNKLINSWFRNQETLNLFLYLAEDLNLQIKCEISRISGVTMLSASHYNRMFPDLIIVKQGSPENGGGVWLHPELAIQLAQWCSTSFAIQVSRWIIEWVTQAKNPFQPNVDQEFEAWKQRYDVRVNLKKELRPELMNAVVNYASRNNLNPRQLCKEVHDQINVRIQGLRSKQIKELGGLPLSELIRDYFDVIPLTTYSSINKLAFNDIQDNNVHPVKAINDACDRYLGRSYTPKPVAICENLYTAGLRIRSKRKEKELPKGIQLSLFDQSA